MKRYYVAAGALLLGTSALAYAPGTETEKGWSEPDKVVAEKSAYQLKDATLDVLVDAGVKAQPASAVTWSEVDEAKAPELAYASETDGWTEGEPKLIRASAVTWQEPEPAAEADPDLDLAEPPVDEAPLDIAAETTAAPVTIASADLTTRPAVDNYPPCAPGPGDDRCIQLYEPGVRTALASWNRPTGGLIYGSDTATAMGGPYEPIDGASADGAMNGDGMVDAATGETAEAELAGI